ncbi:MAG: hypothetical protein JWM21_3571 [Acidobacteria bacterium]|nr:hypothetical protein [Acidobacteriota bacterium]
MTTDRLASTNEYLASTKSVLLAGRELQAALKTKENLNKKNSAITHLAEASDQHDVGTTSYRAFMFSEIESEESTDQPVSTPVAENLFANVLSDLEVANVYITAGQNLGETNEDPKPHLLDDALNRLGDTTTTLESFLTGSDLPGAGTVRYGFAETDVPVEALTSPDKKSAISSFESGAEKALKLIVDEAEDVVTAVIDDIKKLLEKISPAKLLTALEGLGGPLAEAPRLIGQFIQLGIDKIRSVIKTLMDLVGSDALREIGREVVQLWRDVTGGSLVGNLLSNLFAVQKTKDGIGEIIKIDGLDKDKVDKGTNDLAQLALPYQNDMAMAKKAVKVISLSATVLLVIPVAGVKVALLAAAAYGVVLSAVVLVGMDYSDSGRLLKRVRGVGEIANGLRPPV